MESPLMKLERKNKKYSIVLSLWLGATLSDTQDKSGEVPKRKGSLKSIKPQEIGEQMHLVTSQSCITSILFSSSIDKEQTYPRRMTSICTLGKGRENILTLRKYSN